MMNTTSNVTINTLPTKGVSEGNTSPVSGKRAGMGGVGIAVGIGGSTLAVGALVGTVVGGGAGVQVGLGGEME